ncbi:MAG: transporter substrate-binding domain-containing protein [Spirochaetes bacterium]|nr:transporter substrate-binding domain-containing protein [Spirochaetota bacterium]
MFLIILIFNLVLFSCSKNKDTLIVGMELSYPPFEMTDENGNPTGISVDLANEFGKYIKKKIKIQNIPFDGLIPSLQTGKIDLIISSMTITEERAKVVDFSIPYSKAYLAILANKNSNINSIEDLNKKGKVVAVKKGTTGHLYAQKYLTNATINVFDKESSAVIEVVQGKADGFIYDQLSIFRNWLNNKETTIPILKPFQKDFEYWGIVVKKGNKELLQKINDFLIWFKKENGFERLAEKYLKEEKEYFDALGLEFFFSPSSK